MSDAKFKIAGTAFSTAGYDATAGQVVDLQLEASPASDITSCVYSVVQKTKGAATPVFNPSSGIAATPTSVVTITMPASGFESYEVQCQTNGGAAVVGATGRLDDFSVNTKSRIIAVRGVVSGVRKITPAESTQYSPSGWTEAQNDEAARIELTAATPAFASPPALDANHIYGWDCNEASGNLVEKGGSGIDLVPFGAEGTDFHRGSRRLFSGGKSFRSITETAGAGGACAAGANIPASTSLTIEAAICLDQCSDGATIFVATDGTLNNWIELVVGSTGQAYANTLYARTIIGGVQVNTSAYPFALNSTKHHIAATLIDNGGANALKFWLDGYMFAQTAGTAAHLPQLTSVGIGGVAAPGGGFASQKAARGDIGSIRISNIARGQAYMLGAADAIWAQ